MKYGLFRPWLSWNQLPLQKLWSSPYLPPSPRGAGPLPPLGDILNYLTDFNEIWYMLSFTIMESIAISKIIVVPLLIPPPKREVPLPLWGIFSTIWPIFYMSGVPKDIYCYRVCLFSVLCSLSVRTRMAIYAKVVVRFSWNFAYRFVWVVGSLWRNPFFEIPPRSPTGGEIPPQNPRSRSYWWILMKFCIQVCLGGR